jgi:hypothetical protein
VLPKRLRHPLRRLTLKVIEWLKIPLEAIQKVTQAFRDFNAALGDGKKILLEVEV